MANSVFLWLGQAVTFSTSVTSPLGTFDSVKFDVANADTALGRGGAAGKLVLTGTTPMLMFGGTTGSFPALKFSATNRLDVRLADDSAFGDIRLNILNAASALQFGGVLAMSATPPTVTSAGSSPSISASNGSSTFRVNVGTGGVATTIVLAMPAATTGWNAYAENITGTAANRADSRVVVQSSTTNSLTLQYQTISTGAALAFTASDIVAVIAFAF